jgi:hypothetical protein
MGSAHLYMLWVPSGYVKIGVSNDICGRRSTIQIGNHEPVSVLCAVDADDAGIEATVLERSIHEILWVGLHHVRGEWFKAGPHLHWALKVAWAKHKYPRLYDRWVRVNGLEALMEAVTCPHCGQKHWSREPCRAAKPTPQKPTIEELKAIAEPRKPGRPPKLGGPMSASERVRQMRARRKAEKDG